MSPDGLHFLEHYGVVILAALATDLAWYELGRRRGARVLARLCQLSLEPDSCLRRAESIFARHGVRALLAAKFVPGLTTVMPPLAGVFAVARGRFCSLRPRGRAALGGHVAGARILLQ